MDRAPSSLDTLNALELRVLEGPQGGARAPLATGVACVLAAEPDGNGRSADIVLREDRLAPARVRISADLPHALLEVLEGEVRLGEQLLKAGTQANWPMHTPLTIGRSVVAFGHACIDDWTGQAAAGKPLPDLDAQAAAPAARLRHRAEVWLAATGAAILLACAGALWMAHLANASPRATPAGDAAALTAALQNSDFAALAVGTGADGRIELHGRLATLAQRSKLDDWLATRRFAAAVDVQVDEAVAREVTEVFRVNGVPVQAKADGPGRVVAEVAERDHDRLARAVETVKRDVRGLTALNVQNSAKPLPPPATPLVDDPGKRIASLVPGEPAYVVTVDGARYFVGALLPSGHRITQVAQQRVTLERDGQQSTLNF